MCPHSEYRSGCRSYGRNIPADAQGAYFPGDEPGDYCKLTDCLCDRDEEGEPCECPVQERTGLFCEDCIEEDDIALPLTRNACGVVSCPKGHVH